MTAFTIELAVEAKDAVAVRNLANGVQQAIRSAQRRGEHPDVTVIGGPSIATAATP